MKAVLQVQVVHVSRTIHTVLELLLKQTNKRISILRLLLAIVETSGPYIQFTLAKSSEHDITLCTFFRTDLTPPKEITLFEADDSFRGFFRTLKSSLNHKKYDIIHAHTPQVGFLFLVATMFRPRKSLPPTIYTVHSSFPNYKLRNRLLLIPIFAFFQKVVCCSRASYDSFPKIYKWLSGDRLCFVQNGVDIDRIDRSVESKREYPRNDCFSLAALGRLIESKNLLVVLRAFLQSADKSSRLVFVGGGQLSDLLKAQRKELGLETRVELTGLIPREQVYEKLVETDLLVSASRVEGMPIAVLEAMACRCPVLLSDIPPHREIADGADFIPLVDPDDIEGFAREIQRFGRMRASERVEIGEKCRRLVEDRFSLSSMHKRYEEIYAEMLNVPRATMPNG